ncbi:hypothetical protein ACHAQH_001027 [Verticillium albo-atrum]
MDTGRHPAKLHRRTRLRPSPGQRTSHYRFVNIKRQIIEVIAPPFGLFPLANHHVVKSAPHTNAIPTKTSPRNGNRPLTQVHRPINTNNHFGHCPSQHLPEPPAFTPPDHTKRLYSSSSSSSSSVSGSERRTLETDTSRLRHHRPPPKRDLQNTTNHHDGHGIKNTSYDRERNHKTATNRDGQVPLPTQCLLLCCRDDQAANLLWRTQGHVRARSTATTSSAHSLTAASVLQPPSAGQTSRPARPPSADRPPKLSVTANPTTNPHRLLQKKPAFSTLQQHYSPLRNTAPKPTTASYLAPPSPSKLPSNVALTAETARLQTDLLQLHLLHRDAPVTTADWRASAHDQLSQRHKLLASRQAAAADEASSAAAAQNTLALNAWHVTSLEQAVPTLDAALSALPGLESKHDALARRFARWASLIPQDRDAQPEPVLVGALDASWKTDAAVLSRKLENLLRQLDALPGFPEEHAGSDPARALDGCRALARGMLAELGVMEGVERAAVASEGAWIRRVNREDEDARREGPRAGAVWRVI